MKRILLFVAACLTISMFTQAVMAAPKRSPEASGSTSVPADAGTDAYEPPKEVQRAITDQQRRDAIERTRDLNAVMFQKMLEESFPLSPEQIEEYKQRQDANTAAMRSQIVPKLITRTERLSTEPGNAPPIIRLTPGYTTTILFEDATGEPWPVNVKIDSVPDWFKVNGPSTPGFPQNMLTASAHAAHANSNLTVVIDNLPRPAILQLRTNDADDKDRWSTDIMVTYRLDRVGPNGKAPALGARNMRISTTPLMTAFIDNLPPREARKLTTRPEAEDLGIWEYQGRLYVRSRHPVSWPAWTDLALGMGDVRVYEMPLMPLLTLLIEGVPHKLKVEMD